MLTDDRGTEMVDPFTPATELAALVRAREVRPSELVEACLERVERHGPALNAFCHVAAGEARAAAREQDARLDAGETELPPFFGVPTAIKDLHPVAGWALCSASNGAAHPLMERDAAAVAALRGAGLVFVGGTTSPEFGTVSVTDSDRHGVTRNPWDLGRSPGGSSGGAAAAVAAGVLPLAHGSDGAGSIREPASYCGLVGLKPSRALVPSDIHAMEGLATEGVLTRTVADTAVALDVFHAAPRRSWYVAPQPARPYAESAAVDPPRLRIGLNLTPAFPGVDVHENAVRIGRASADLLSDLGHDVVEVTWPGLDQEWFERTFDVLYATGSADVPIEDEARIELLNRTLRARARENDSLTYVDAIYQLQFRSAELIGLFDDVDVVLTPTNPLLAPPEGWQWEGQEQDPWRPLRRAEQTASFTVLGNVLGLPAISVPLFAQPDGLPLGTQLIGRPWQDGTVLSLAGQLERARPWHDRRPEGFA